MDMPRLPGDPHLVTLAYLLGLLGLAVVAWLVYRLIRQSQDER